MNLLQKAIWSPPCILITGLLLICGFITSCGPVDNPAFKPYPADQRLPDHVDQYLKVEDVLVRLSELSIRKQLDSLLLLSDLLKNHQEDVALVYAQEANKIAVRENKPFSRGISSYYVALLNGGKEIYGEGIEDPMVDAQISKNLFDAHRKYAWLVRANRLIGDFFFRREEYDSARIYLDHALQLIDSKPLAKEDSLKLRGEVFFELANVYGMNDTAKLSAAYQESLELFRLTNYESMIARLHKNMGITFVIWRRFDEAEELFNKSLKYAETYQDSNLLQHIQLNMGLLYKQLYRYKSDEDDFSKALTHFQTSLHDQKENRYQALENIGILYQLKAQRTENLDYLDSALIFYKLAMEDARNEGALSVVKNMGNNISNLCAFLDNQTSKNCENILNANPFVFINENYRGIVNKMRLDFDLANVRKINFQRTELEAKAQIKRQTQWLISGTTLLTLLFVFLLLYQRQQQQRLQARMDALRAQINPHFISNSLNAIENLVNMNQREAASKYLIHFSRFSRRILSGSRNPNISLSEELETTKHFLALEKLRFRDKLDYEIEIAENLNPGIIEVPSMILQPYIENAILHGIKPKKEHGKLKIKAEKVDQYLVCTIEDNGIGRAKSRELKEASLKARQSIGMAITEERIKGTGKKRGAKVEIIDLIDESANALGTKVILRMPLKKLKEKVT